MNAHRINQGLMPEPSGAPGRRPRRFLLHRAGGPRAGARAPSLELVREPHPAAVRPRPAGRHPGPDPDAQGDGRGRPTSTAELQEALNPGEGGVAARGPALPGRRQGHADPQQLRQGGLQRRHRPDRAISTTRSRS
ncbi:MAG: hypothetical protein MZU91_07180 [Desulfosudis oleivorans]|nr:hypothetical protein [Desulfosudis oleivorans]